MSRRMPPLNWIRAFEASARHLSFTGAARDLNLTSTAVSHQVRALEGHLGQPLFDRLASALRLTEMGAAYLPDVRRALDDLAASTARLFGQSSLTSVTLRAPISFVSLWLSPRLPRFQARFPGIDVLLFSTVWAAVEAGQSADLEVRFGDGAWEGFSSEPLWHDPSTVICHRDVARRGTPAERLRALAAHGLIHVVGHENHWGEAFRAQDLPPPEPARSLRVDNSLAAATLAAAGGGAAIVLRRFALRAAELLPLRLPLDLALPVQQSHFLLTPQRRGPARPEALLLRQWLLEEARAEA